MARQVTASHVFMQCQRRAQEIGSLPKQERRAAAHDLLLGIASACALHMSRSIHPLQPPSPREEGREAALSSFTMGERKKKADRVVGSPLGYPSRVIRTPFFLEWMGAKHSERGMK